MASALATTATACLLAFAAAAAPACNSHVETGGRAEPAAAADQELPSGDDLSGDDLVDARLLCADDALVPGTTTTLGIALDVAEGWHVYGHAANDSGYPPQLDWELPDGLTVGETLWPAPERHVSPGDILDHVYVDQVTLLVPLAVDADLPPGEATLQLDLEWLVCETICLIGERSLRLTLPVLAVGSRPGRGAGAEAITASRARLPEPAPADLQLDLEPTRATLALPGARALAFYPAPDCVPLEDLLGEAQVEGDRLVLTRAARGPGGDRLLGVLAVTPADGPTRYHAVEHPPRPGDR